MTDWSISIQSHCSSNITLQSVMLYIIPYKQAPYITSYMDRELLPQLASPPPKVANVIAAMKKTNLLLALLIATLTICLSNSEELCHPNDKKALLQIKTHFGDPYILASWKADTDCCTQWNQVECDPNTNRVISLVILAGELSGEIPPAVGDLPYLQTLEFHKLTNVTGPIQPAIAKLTNLTILRLTWLNLTGPVPGFLSKLKKLRFLQLSFNSLSGSIPSSLASLENLFTIELDRNRLTGPIPESFGTFKGSIPVLQLSHNQLSGTLPASLGNLNFDRIDFSRNQLEGDASMLFGPNKSTYLVDLSRNQFEFNLSNVIFPSSLQVFDVNHNKIYGSFPEQITQLDLISLNVSYNRLCGQIPFGGKMQSFDSSAYFHNRCLCGAPLDSCK